MFSHYSQALVFYGLSMKILFYHNFTFSQCSSFLMNGCASSMFDNTKTEVHKLMSQLSSLLEELTTCVTLWLLFTLWKIVTLFLVGGQYDCNCLNERCVSFGSSMFTEINTFLQSPLSKRSHNSVCSILHM